MNICSIKLSSVKSQSAKKSAAFCHTDINNQRMIFGKAAHSVVFQHPRQSHSPPQLSKKRRDSNRSKLTLPKTSRVFIEIEIFGLSVIIFCSKKYV
jgi:hypothetical protein